MLKPIRVHLVRALLLAAALTLFITAPTPSAVLASDCPSAVCDH